MSDLGDFDPEPNKSEPADMGGGESTGAQDLVNGDTDDEPPQAESQSIPSSVEQRDGPQRLEEVMTENTETRHTLSESADKITLKADVKRGSDTRDQDKINVKVKGDNPEATAKKLADTLAALESEGVADTLRQTQPGDSE